MTVRITPFANALGASPRYSSGGIVPVLGGQSADRIDLAVGTEHHTADFTDGMVVAIDVTTDCFIAIGVNATADVAKSEPWTAGTSDFRYVKVGERVSVI